MGATLRMDMLGVLGAPVAKLVLVWGGLKREVGELLTKLRGEEGAEEVRVGEGEPKRLELMGSSSPGLASWRTLGGAGEVVPVSGLGGAIAPGSDGKLL